MGMMDKNERQAVRVGEKEETRSCDLSVTLTLGTDASGLRACFFSRAQQRRPWFIM